MVRWKVKKAKYPVDPTRPWMAIPGGSIMRARRFATWAEAQKFATSKTKRRTPKKP